MITLNKIFVKFSSFINKNSKQNFRHILHMSNVERRENMKEILERKEKQIPKKPIFNHNLSDTLSVFHCECGNTIKVSHDIGIMNNNNAPNYCSKCGCRLDWSEENKEKQ